MSIISCRDYEEMSELAYKEVVVDIRQFQGQLICAATGNSVRGLYKRLSAKFRDDPGPFEKLGVLKLDEWLGIGEGHPSSCESYLREHLTGPLGISTGQFIGFKSMADDPLKECKRVEKSIALRGGIGCCILGLGVNGHIGFNEPGDFLHPYCHVATLSDSSLGHSMLTSSDIKPKFGFTLGIGTILQARKIVLLLTGKGKKQVIENWLSQKITPRLPASFLWAHPGLSCYRDLETTS